MDNNFQKLNITYKGIKDNVPESEQKSIDINTASIKVDKEVVWGVPGTRHVLGDKSKEEVGAMYLWESDPVLEDSVKLKFINVDDLYRGSGAVDILYKDAVEVAKKNHKNLVLDCKAGAAAYKSFKKFAERNNLEIVENEKNIFNDVTNSYEAPNGEWTLKIILQN